MARKKLTRVQKENKILYQKERKRVLSSFNSLLKKGFTIDDIIPEHTATPTKKDIAKLKKITTDTLYSHAQIEIDTGEWVTGKEYKKQSRSNSARKAQQTRKDKKEIAKTLANKSFKEFADNRRDYIRDKVKENRNIQQREFSSEPLQYESIVSNTLTRFIDNLNGYPAGVRDYLLNWLENIKERTSVEQVAGMLLEGTKSVSLAEYMSRKMYPSDANLQDYTSEMLLYLPDITEQGIKDLMDEIEYNEGNFNVE